MNAARAGWIRPRLSTDGSRSARGRGRLLAVVALLGGIMAACGPKSVTRPVPVAVLRSPAYSPDSTRLAFVVEEGAGMPASGPGLYLMDIATGAATLLSTTGNWPTWEPGGHIVAYANPELTLTNVQNFVTTALDSFPVEFPDWSPDGTLIAYCTGHGDPHGFRAISIVQSDGKHPTDISVHGTGEWLWPSWSPTSQWIVHTRVAPGANVAQLYLMTARGDSTRQLSFSGAHEAQPTWSPDSQYVALMRVTSATPGIWVMRADGSGAHFVAAGQDPSWLPHAHTLVYSLGSPEKTHALGVIDIDGANQHLIVPSFSSSAVRSARARGGMR